MYILAVGATTDYALLLVARYREELRRHESTYDALRRALRRSTPPIVASGVTVILCLLTLIVSDLALNRALGPTAAIGIFFAMTASLTLLPAFLLIGGERARGIFWPKSPRFDPTRVEHVDTLRVVEKLAGVWGRVSRTVAKHPRRTWVAALVGLGIFAAFFPSYNANGLGDDEAFLGELESMDGLAILEDHFAAGQTNPIEIQASADRLDEVLAAVLEVDGIAGAYPLTPATLSQGLIPDDTPIVIDGRVAIDAISEVSASSQEAKELIQVLRPVIVDADSTALVGGTAAINLDVNLTTERDISVIIPLVLAVIFLVLVALLRAVIAPLIIIGANLLSFAATLGLAALMFNHVMGMPKSDAFVPLYGFVFLVALGVDYSIFLMSRAREETLARGTREGIRRALAVTGGVITSAGIVLAATFGAIAILPVVFMIQMAFIVAAGILIDTFVVRTLLLPGLVYDIDRVSWWPWNANIKA
jgi:RND superfamily putative drug exporter